VVSKVRAGEWVSTTSRVRERDPNLRLYVVFTDAATTKRAIQTAAHLAGDLNARLVLLVAKVVPYPLSLDSPPVCRTFTDAVLSQLAAGQDVEITVRVYLCRDRDETIRNELEPGSLVVIGRRKSWWRSPTSLIGRLLKRDGHQVVLVDLHRTQPSAVVP
jgi:hypothetical protein